MIIHNLYTSLISSTGTETAESLKSKVQALEGQTFVEAVELFRSGKVGPYSTVCSQAAVKSANTEVRKNHRTEEDRTVMKCRTPNIPY